MTPDERVATLVLYGCRFGAAVTPGFSPFDRYIYHPSDEHKAVLHWLDVRREWARNESAAKSFIKPLEWDIELIESMPKLTFNNWLQYITR